MELPQASTASPSSQPLTGTGSANAAQARLLPHILLPLDHLLSHMLSDSPAEPQGLRPAHAARTLVSPAAVRTRAWPGKEKTTEGEDISIRKIGETTVNLNGPGMDGPDCKWIWLWMDLAVNGPDCGWTWLWMLLAVDGPAVSASMSVPTLSS